MKWPLVAAIAIFLFGSPLLAEDDPTSAINNIGGVGGGAVLDPTHAGGVGGYGRRYSAPGSVGSGGYFSRGACDVPGQTNNIFAQVCSKCHALPSASAARSAIQFGVNGVRMPPGNPGLGQQVLNFLNQNNIQ